MSNIDWVALSWLKQLTPTQQRDIARFVDANRNRKQVDEVSHMQWVSEALQLLSNTTFTKVQKKQVVTALYRQMASGGDVVAGNDFRVAFNVDKAIDFVWDSQAKKYGLELNKKGCMSWLPCCSSFEVAYDGSDGGFSLNVLPIDPKASTAPPTAVQSTPAASVPVASVPVASVPVQSNPAATCEQTPPSRAGNARLFTAKSVTDKSVTDQSLTEHPQNRNKNKIFITNSFGN